MATKPNRKHFTGGLARVLAEKWQADVRLKAVNSDDGSAIFAHKPILASRSEVFKKILESDEFKTSSNQMETITLPELKQEELEAFVEFIYSDGSKLSEKVKQHVKSLYLAADKYEILHLRDLCRIELISSLNLSNSLVFLKLAQIPFDKFLNDAAFSHVQENISEIASSDEFKFFVIRNPILGVEIMKASLIGGRCLCPSCYCFKCGIKKKFRRLNTSGRNCRFYCPSCRSVNPKT